MYGSVRPTSFTYLQSQCRHATVVCVSAETFTDRQESCTEGRRRNCRSVVTADITQFALSQYMLASETFNYCPSMLCHCWFGSIVPDMTYNVSGGTLNPTLLLVVPFSERFTFAVLLSNGSVLCVYMNCEWISAALTVFFIRCFFTQKCRETWHVFGVAGRRQTFFCWLSSVVCAEMPSQLVHHAFS